MRSIQGCFVFIFALTTGFAGWLAWREYTENIDLHAQILKFQTDDRLPRQVAELQKQNKVLQSQVLGLRLRGEQSAGAKPAPPPSAVRIGGLDSSGNPSLIQLTPAQLSAVVEHRDGPFLNHLALSADQMAQVSDLLAKRQQAAVDAVNAGLQQGMNPRTDLAELRQAIAQAQSEYNTQIEAQLGTAGYAQFQQYEQSAPQRNTVAILQQGLGNISAPLTDDQALAMVPIIAQTEQPDDGVGIGRALFGSMDYHARITPQTITAATAVLSPPQVQVLQVILQQQQPMQLQSWETQAAPIRQPAR